jgi:hypothetical protein
VHYGNTIGTQANISSLAGIYTGSIDHTWATILSAGLVALWVAEALRLVWHARRLGLTPDDDRWWWAVARIVVAWLCVTPYTHPPDLVLAAVAVPLLLGRRLEGLADDRARLALGVLLAVPELDFLGFRVNYVFCASLLMALTLWWALAARERAILSRGPIGTAIP